MNAYPLSWPAGWKRTEPSDRTRGKFAKMGWSGEPGSAQNFRHARDLSLAEAVSRLLGELGRFGVVVGDSVISTNVPVRLDGLPRGDARVPADPGVAVYWQRLVDQAPKVMAIDRYDRVQDNVAAVAATLEAMRAIERHGGAVILDRAFTGFTALPSPIAAARPWREVLGLTGATVSPAVVKDAYRKARGAGHPDKGGSPGAFVAVQDAYHQAARELGFEP